MKVKELAQWLSSFEDQDADILVVAHTSGTGYYDQGGNAMLVNFNPDLYVTYNDLRGNPYIKPTDSNYNRRTLVLGEIDG